jgi:hypothetical protein
MSLTGQTLNYIIFLVKTGEGVGEREFVAQILKRKKSFGSIPLQSCKQLP